MPMFSQIKGRESSHRHSAINVCKTLAQTAVFWFVFLAVIPGLLIWIEKQFDGWPTWSSAPSRIIGGFLFIVGGSLGLTSGMVMAIAGKGTPMPMDCPNHLVVAGPYRYIRNPMVIAGLAQGLAVGIYFGSWLVIAYSICGGAVWNWLVRPWEEQDLAERFGVDYEQYRRAVPCWRPRMTRWTPLRNE